MRLQPPSLNRRRPAQQLRQLGDVHGDAPGLVAGEQLGRRSPPEFILAIDVGERLTISIADDEAGVGFLGRPGRREAALGHSLRVAKFAKRGFDVAFDVIRCVWIFC